MFSFSLSLVTEFEWEKNQYGHPVIKVYKVYGEQVYAGVNEIAFFFQDKVDLKMRLLDES